MTLHLVEPSPPLWRVTRRHIAVATLVIWVVLLNACSVIPDRDSAPSGRIDPSSIPDAVPKAEPKSRYGNPRSYVVNGQRYFTLPSARGFVERGVASWYGRKFHGRRTSSGEIYDMYAMTAAHRTLPLPSYVSVRNLATGHKIVVRVNDRGPFHDNRVLDLSYAAASKLGIARKGTGKVEIRVLDPASAPAIRTEPRRAQVVSSGAAAIFVQAGAFHMSTNAQRLRARLTGRSEVPIRTVQADYNGRLLYRVQLGPVSSLKEANQVVNALYAFGFERPQIVIE